MFTFVANLKPYTYHRGRGHRRFDAYLLSVDFASGELDELATSVTRDGHVLCADNGNVDRIRALIRRFEPAAAALQRQRRRAEKALGVEYARPNTLPAVLRASFRSLARDIKAAAKAEAANTDMDALVAQQNELCPAYLIGMEDFTVSTLTGLSVEPEYSALPKSFYRACTKRALKFVERTKAGRYGEVDARVFAGLHALDYDTAVLAGELAGNAGVDGIATGLVGALTDKNYVDFRVQDGRVIDLPQAVPRPYLRVMEVASGLHTGYARATGARPRFHALGAGSPILIPLLALLGDRQTYTATDSTAPIVDGWTAPTTSLYVTDPAPLKYKAHRIVEYWLAEGRGWRCRCGYCRAFNSRHPPKVRAARAWWRADGMRRITSHDLASTRPLAAWFPFLGRHPDGEIRRAAALARVGHNHGVLQHLERVARRHSQTRKQLLRWVESVVEAYLGSAAGASWKAATYAAWQVASQAVEDLRGANPTPLQP